MTQLTLQEIPIEAAMKSGDAVLAQWDEYDLQCEVGWDIVRYSNKEWCRAEDSYYLFATAPSRVYELPGGVE